MKDETIKFTGNPGECLHELGGGQVFLSRIQKTLTIRGHIDKSYYFNTFVVKNILRK